eukprot:599750-Pyramimonas_sp.AAC.1
MQAALTDTRTAAACAISAAASSRAAAASERAAASAELALLILAILAAPFPLTIWLPLPAAGSDTNRIQSAQPSGRAKSTATHAGSI